MDILDIKINKEKLKELAKNSVLFSVSSDDLYDFIKLVDSIEEDETGAEKIKFLLEKFQQESLAVSDGLKKALE